MEIALWIIGGTVCISIIWLICLSGDVEILEDEQNLHDEIIEALEALEARLELTNTAVKLHKTGHWDYALSKSEFYLFLDSIGYKYVPASTTPAKFVKVKK